MQLLPLRLIAMAVALALPSSGCGGDDDGDGSSDGPPSDAALGADSSEILPDAGATTTCSNGEDIMYCDRATEICVLRELGPGVIPECAELPVGCDATRDCASCDGVCSESDDCLDGDGDNTIICACTECA